MQPVIRRIIVTSTSTRRASRKKYLGLCLGKSGSFFRERRCRCSSVYDPIYSTGRDRLNPRDFLLLNVTTSDSPLRLPLAMDSEAQPEENTL